MQCFFLVSSYSILVAYSILPASILYGQGMNLVACIIDTIQQNRDQYQSPNR